MALAARRGRAHAAMAHQHFGQLAADFHVRCERRHMVLEDHGHTVAADGVEARSGRRQQISAAEPRLAGGTAVGRQQAHGGHEGLAFTGAGFADDAEAFALGHGQGQVAHRFDVAVHGGKAHVEIAVDVEHGRARPSGGRHQRSFGSRASRKPSPRKLKQNKVTVMNTAGTIRVRGLISNSVAPSLINTPQLVMGSCTPSPK